MILALVPISATQSLDIENRFTPNVTPSSALTLRESSVSNVNVFSRQKADYWAGFFGNSTESISVGEENTLFEWNDARTEYIYYSTDTLNFSAEWRNASREDLKSQFDFLPSLGPESPNTTFDSSGVVDSRFQSGPVTSVAAETPNSSGNDYWSTVYLNDSQNGLFATEITRGTSFRGASANFQSLLPANRSKGTVYRTFLEVE
jgi:hypothetical protein